MKAILYTFSATITVVLLAATVFWNSILGAFGFATIPFERLQMFQASHQALQAKQAKVRKMQEHHETKKLSASKKLAKKSAKRVTSTALAASTIGTTAVVGTMIALEVEDYCAEKKLLQEDANILYETNFAFDSAQCIREAEQDAEAIWVELKSSSNKKIMDAINVTAEYSATAWASVREATIQAMQTTGNVSAAVWDKVRSIQGN